MNETESFLVELSEAKNHEAMKWLRWCQGALSYFDGLKLRQPESKGLITEICSRILEDMQDTNQAILEREHFISFFRKVA